MNYKISCNAQKGFNRILNIADVGMKLTGFGLLQLDAGETYKASSGDSEIVMVVLGGRCSVRGKDFCFASIGERNNVFDGLPYTVFIPAGENYEVTAITNVEVAVSESPTHRRGGKAGLILPNQVKSMSIGNGNFTRQALIMLDEQYPAEHLFIGEALVPPGNWASFPPHRHDFDNLPEEVDMEEIYFFRFNHAGGFGIQRLYTDTRDIDATYTVHENDTIAIPRGYHPVVNAPGATMYYLWVMAGKTRGFISHKDPEYSWIK